MKETKPVHTIKHGRVHYCYMVGISWIAIWTDAKTRWKEMPGYMRVSFNVPAKDWTLAASLAQKPNEDDPPFIKAHYEREHGKLERFILKAIRQRIAEQRKTDAGTIRADRRMGKHSDKQEQEKAVLDTSRKGRKAAAPMLPFPDDADADAGERAV